MDTEEQKKGYIISHTDNNVVSLNNSIPWLKVAKINLL